MGKFCHGAKGTARRVKPNRAEFNLALAESQNNKTIERNSHPKLASNSHGVTKIIGFEIQILRTKAVMSNCH